MSDIDILNSVLPANPERVWKDIPDYEGRYVVSNDGHVGSLSRTVRSGLTRSRTIRTRILKPIIRKSRSGGVISCCVHLSQEDGPTLSSNIGRLVLIAFQGEAHGLVASYRDGNPSHTDLRNLYWTTPSDIGVNALNGGYGQVLRGKAAQARWGARA